jgi:uncharacterized protein involved in exopolysaccharide biosynthesis
MDVWGRRKWLALMVFAGVVTFAASLAAFVPNVYRATVTFVVERQEATESLARPGSELDLRLQTLGEKILSRARLADLIRRFNLYPEMRGQGASMEAATRQMRRDVLLVPKSAEQLGDRGGTIALALSYWGKDPVTVARVANALASSYVDENLQSRQRQAEGAVSLLKAQVDEAKERLEKTSDKQARLVQRQRVLTRPLVRPDSPAAASPDARAAQIAQLRLQLADLKTQFKDRYPDVVRLQEQIKYLQSLPPDRSLSTPRPAEPPPTSAPSAPGGETLTQVDAGLLASDYETAKEHYLSLVKMYEEARLDEQMAKEQQGDQFQILDPALTPDQPASSASLIILAGGLVAALAAAFGAAALAERLDSSFHTRSDLREFTRVPILASISRIATPVERRRRRGRVFLRFVSAMALLLVLVGVSYCLAHWSEPWLVLLTGKHA